jgi:transposase-like protein
MVRPGRELLSGELEVDESYLGGPRSGTRGRGALGKQIVAIAAEALPRGTIGRIRIARIPDCSEETLTGFVAAAAEPGSVIYTDHWSGYNGLAGAGFQHWPTNVSASGNPAHVAMPRVHRVASLLKRWLLGTHHGGVKPGQLDAYLQEFVFRSTAAPPSSVASSSTGSLSRPSRSSRSPSSSSSPDNRDKLPTAILRETRPRRLGRRRHSCH